MTIEEVAAQIQAPDRSFWDRAQARLDRLTKPPGSLGRLEELAARYVMLTARQSLRLRPIMGSQPPV